MIGAIRGRVLECSANRLYLETSAGVVYEILLAQKALETLGAGAEALVYTSLIVRENEMFLMGFQGLAEKNLFETLITAKGIGPKQGMKILDSIGPSELRLAIVSGDARALAKIKGLGAKKAEQVILDLRDKMEKTSAQDLPPSSGGKKKMDILLTMRALGYGDGEIKKPLDEFFERCNRDDSLENLAAAFLRSLKP